MNATQGRVSADARVPSLGTKLTAAKTATKGMAAPSSQADIEQGLTIDQIALDAQIPVSTVRLYQNKGLLPAPERRGRVGFYNKGHRDRLRLSFEQLGERFEGVSLEQADIQRAVEIGLIEIDGASVVVSNEAFVDIGPEVAKLGIPVAEVLDEYEAVTTAVGDIAERFRALFDRHLWEPFAEDGMLAEDIPSLTDDIARLASLATSVVTAELHERFAEFASDYVERAEEQNIQQ